MPIPVADYGGTERVVWSLGKELVRLGHQVTFLVPPGSTCPFAKVLVYDPQKPINEQIPTDIDVVHLFFLTKEKLDKPYLMTQEGNFFEGQAFDVNTVFVSQDHAQRNQAQAFVYNGIDLEEYGEVDFNVQRKYLLFLGYEKLPSKNVADCLRISRKTGNVLAVVGGKPKWFKWRPWVEYKGFLGGAAKNKMLQSSKALLFPVRWHEPFGLAIVEALYFGCPVIGTPYGSLPELVRPDVGFLSNKRSELVEAVRNLDRYDPRACHEYVRGRFTSKHMTAEYLKLYEKVLDGQPLNLKPPVNGGNFSQKELLPIY